MTRFDRIARLYDIMEAVLAGRKLERCRMAFDAELSGIRHALLAGEGHGKFLASLLHRNPQAKITCVDASARMLDIARDRLLREHLPMDRVEFIHADILEWQAAPGTYDLIATQFFLDCFTEKQLAQVIPHLAAAGCGNARWLVTDFQIPARGWQRIRARIIHWLMYRFFRSVTNLPASALTPPQDFLRKSHFTRLSHREFEWGLLYAELWQRNTDPTANLP